MSEETVEEIVKSYTRRELDEMAEALGLSSADYPNKRSIAAAILTAREEQRERERLEREREARMQEWKKKMVEDTVKGKIVAIKVTAEEMQKSVREQMNENREAVATIQSGVQELVKVNQAYAKNFQSLVEEQTRENQEAVAAVQTGIQEQMNENQAYVKSFYG